MRHDPYQLLDLTPEQLEKRLNVIPPHLRKKVVEECCNDLGQPLIESMVYYPEALKILLSIYTEPEEREKVILETNTRHATLLHAAIPELSVAFPGTGVRAYVNECDKKIHKLSIELQKEKAAHLAHHINHTESFRILVNSIENSEERLLLCTKANRDQQTLLQKGAPYPNILKQLLAILPKENRLEAIQNAHSSHDLNPFILSTHHIESFEMMLALFPSKKEAADYVIKLGPQLLKFQEMSPLSFVKILSFYPSDEACFELIQSNPVFLEDMFKKISLNGSLESLKHIFRYYPNNKARCDTIETYQMLRMNAAKPPLLAFLLSCFANNVEALSAVKTQIVPTYQSDQVEGQVEYLSAYCAELESLKIILALYPNEESRLKALKEKYLCWESKCSVFEVLASSYYAPDYWNLKSLYPQVAKENILDHAKKIASVLQTNFGTLFDLESLKNSFAYLRCSANPEMREQLLFELYYRPKALYDLFTVLSYFTIESFTETAEDQNNRYAVLLEFIHKGFLMSKPQTLTALKEALNAAPEVLLAICPSYNIPTNADVEKLVFLNRILDVFHELNDDIFKPNQEKTCTPSSAA